MNNEDDIERALSICGYCFREIAESEEGLAFSGTLTRSDGADPAEFVGHAVEISKGDHFIIAVVPEDDAEGLEEGENLMFFVCSETCANSLQSFIELAVASEVQLLSDAAFTR